MFGFILSIPGVRELIIFNHKISFYTRMYKNFAASLIPAIVVARGTGDGSSFDNAAETWLIPG